MVRLFKSLAILAKIIVVFIFLGCKSETKERYEVFYLGSPPAKVHVVSIDKNQLKDDYDLRLKVTAERLKLIQQVSKSEENQNVLAAINGGFMAEDSWFSAKVRGPLIVGGHLVQLATTHPTHPAIFVSDNEISMGTLFTKLEIKVEGVASSLSYNEYSAREPVLLTASKYNLLDKEATKGYIVTSLISDVHFLTEGLPLSESSDEKKGSIEYSFELSNEDDRRFAEKLYLLTPNNHELAIYLDTTTSASIVLRYRIVPFGDVCSTSKGALLSDFELVLGVGQVLLDTNKGTTRALDSLSQGVGLKTALSALCWNQDNFYMVAADGLSFSLGDIAEYLLGLRSSIGLTISQLAHFQSANLMCQCGLQLDGGSSSALYANGKIMTEGLLAEEKLNNIVLLTQREVN